MGSLQNLYYDPPNHPIAKIFHIVIAMGALLGTAAALNKLSGISIRTLTDWCNIFIIIIVMVIVVFITMLMVMMVMMMIGRMAQDVGSRQVNRATGRSKVPSNRHHQH